MNMDLGDGCSAVYAKHGEEARGLTSLRLAKRSHHSAEAPCEPLCR